jgi:hypothetical protein
MSREELVSIWRWYCRVSRDKLRSRRVCNRVSREDWESRRGGCRGRWEEQVACREGNSRMSREGFVSRRGCGKEKGQVSRRG